MEKWIAGILASVIAGVILFFILPNDQRPSGPNITPNQNYSSGIESANISGTWIGQVTILGSDTKVRLILNQANSGSVGSASQALTGKLYWASGGEAISITGSKKGDSWSVSGVAGDSVFSFRQTLSSATESNGEFTLQVAAPSNKGTVSCSLTKL